MSKNAEDAEKAQRPSTIMLADLNRDEVREIAPHCTVILPVCAIEQHGPHLPIGTDFEIGSYVATAGARLARRHVPVLVAPALAFGISGYHMPHPGVLTLSPRVFIDVVSDVLTSLVKSGFRRLIILNSHNGNSDAAGLIARELNSQHSITISAANYWTAAWGHIERSGVFSRIPASMGHADAFETALMSALRPELINPALIPAALPLTDSGIKPRIFVAGTRHGLRAGYNGDPALGTREVGLQLLNAVSEGVADFITKLHRSHPI